MSTLYLIATPIGNLSDMTPRAIETLRRLEVLFCEDTRRTGNLLALLDVPRPRVMLSNHEHNEKTNAQRLLQFLNQGNDVGICSDAGYPIISDPGYPAVSAAVAAGHAVCPLPGANAALLAVTASGLPCQTFLFKGFAPRRPSARRRFIEIEADTPHTLIFYESPYRILSFLQEALAILGNRRAAVCMELTKQFERIYRNTLAELVASPEQLKLKGEAVIVIEGYHEPGEEPDTGYDRNDCRPDDDGPSPEDIASGYVRRA